MNRLYFKDMTSDEQLKLYNECEALQDRNRNDYFEYDAYFWVDDVLHNAPKSIDYSIGACNYNYIRFDCYLSNYNDIFEYFQELQNDYCMFSDDLVEKFSKCLTYIDVMQSDGYTINVNNNDYMYMENFVDSTISDASDALCEYCADIYNAGYDDEYMLDRFRSLECKGNVNDSYYDDYYIINDDYTTMYFDTTIKLTA